jgi:hypothetical protein
MWGRGRKVGVFVRILVGALAIPVALVAAFFFLPALGRVSPEALQYSVTRESGGTFLFFGSDQCRRRRRGVWRCHVTGPGGSGADVYRVTMRERTCWSARKVHAGAAIPLPARVSGCVGVRDQLRVVARMGDRVLEREDR